MGNKNSVPVTLFEKFINQFNHKISLLEREVLLVTPSNEKSTTIFLSICNGKDRATVLHESQDTLENAWKAVVKKGEKLIKNSKLNPLWIKADIVTNILPISNELLQKTLSNYRPYFMRKGISFDENFETAFIESELNCNGIIDYKNNEINLLNLNNYQKHKGDSLIKVIPSRLIFFEAQGFICEDEHEVKKLYIAEIDYGRRASDTSFEDILFAVNTASNFLFNQIQEDGQFTYGYHPIFNKKIDSYNILRHTSTTWTLLSQYNLTKDKSLIPKIEKTIRYMTENYIVYKDENTCFLLEKSTSEIKLGGNGIAVVVLCIYMDIYKTDCFESLVVKLGNGILSLQDQTTGEYYHVLNYPDFLPKEKHRVVYYDGEATFALCKLFSLTKDILWLNCATKAVDFFINNHYEKYVDHWIAYSINELSKHISTEKYLSFGLRNVQVNLDRIYNQDTSFHTYMEMILVTFEMLARILKNNIKLDYLNGQFDQEYFIKTIYKRATHMLNGYMYPEYAMYFKSPATILGAFCVRHHRYRVRIDGVQHFLGGYYLYLLNYDKLAAFRQTYFSV